MALVAHLRGDFVKMVGGLPQGPRLRNVVAERLLAIHIDAPFHRHHGDGGMVMIGSRNKNGVNTFSHLIEHDAVVRKGSSLGSVHAFSFQPAGGMGMPLLIRIDNGGEVLLMNDNDLLQMRSPPAAAADLHEVENV